MVFWHHFRLPSPDQRVIGGADDQAERHSFEFRDGTLLWLWGAPGERVDRMKAEYENVLAAGASIVAIGQADGMRTQHFAQKASVPCMLLSDVTRSAYKAFDLLEATPSQVVYGMPEGFLRRDRTMGESFLKSRQGTDRSPVDSPWQLPGEFVVAQDAVIKLAHRSQYCADYGHPDVLLAAVRESLLGL